MARLVENMRVTELLNSVTDGDSKARLLAIIEEIKTIAVQEGWCYRRRIPVLSVGVHKKNRGGYGVTGLGAIEVCKTIDLMGFCEVMMDDASCLEDDIFHSNEVFTIELSKHDEILPEWKTGMVEFASMACGHTNQLWEQ